MRVRMAPGYEARIEVAVNRTVNRAAEAIAEDVRRYAPVDTGAMRAGVSSTPAVGGRAYVTVSRNVPGEDPLIPVYVEYGTRHMDAQPFMRPAAYQKRSL